MAQAKLRDELLAPAVAAPTMLSMHDIMELTRSRHVSQARGAALAAYAAVAHGGLQRLGRGAAAQAAD